MNKLFLIDGAAGAGKSDLINFIKKNMTNYDVNVIPKFTTREKRKKEEAKETDLNMVNEREFEEWKSNNLGKIYTYQYCNAEYAFSKTDLLDSVKNHEFTFVIVGNENLIYRLKEELKEIVYVRHIYIYTDTGFAERRLREEGFGEQTIKFRFQRNNQLWENYLHILDDDVIIVINNSDKDDFHRIIQVLLNKYSKQNERKDMLIINTSTQFELITPLIGYKDKLQRQLERFPYEQNVFLMMKFRDNNKDFYKFIKRGLERKGLNCVRADEAEWNLTNDVYNPLAVLYCCKYGIALFDEPEEHSQYNPNVAYELGMMHYQKKDCLIMRHSSLIEMPFDLIKNLYVTYTEKYQFEEILDKWLKSLEI